MATRWVPIVATVSWRSERRARERPVAVVFGGETFPVEEERSWIEGPAVAGGPVVAVFVVRDANGRRFRLRAREAHETLVEIDAGEGGR